MKDFRRITLFCMILWLSLAGWVTTADAQVFTSSDKALPAKDSWMKELSDTVRLCSITLPGTHDSGAVTGGAELQTQTLGVAEQLQAGIRAFDIRLRGRDGKLGLYHSVAFQNSYWETDVLPAMLDFLRRHPSETLVVSLKREGGSQEEYARLLSRSLSDEGNRSCFVPEFTDDLRLGTCRGRILFLHRDDVMPQYPGVRCVGWADNATCTLTVRTARGVNTTLHLQDEYQYESIAQAPGKLEAVMRSLRVMSSGSDCCAGISFVSATALPVDTPILFAYQLNEVVAQRIVNESLSPRGIIFIDFVHHPGGVKLVEQLIRCNYSK